MTDPKVEILGPYDWINEDDRSKGVQSRGGTNVYLWNVEEFRADNRADINASNVPGLDSDETILGGFLGREEFSLSGTASGNRLAGKARQGTAGRNGLPTDRYTALKEYLYRLESLVQQDQGIGYSLIDDQRNRSIDPSSADPDDWNGFIVESITWELSSGEKFNIDYTLEGTRAQGVSIDNNRQVGINNRNSWIEEQKSNWVVSEDTPYSFVDGSIPSYIPYSEEFDDRTSVSQQQTRGQEIIDPVPSDNPSFYLGTVETLRVEKSVNVDIKEIALGDPGDNIALPVESPQYTIFIEGNLSPQDTLQRADIDTYDKARERMNTFAKYIPNKWVGNNRDIYYRDTFTDRQWRGQVKNYSTTWESGNDVKLNYTIEIIVGKGVGTQSLT